MKKILVLLCFLCISNLFMYAQNGQFGQITLTPIVLENSGLEGKAAQLMENKLNILLTQHSMAGGIGQNFILTPKCQLLNETTTASIPQKAVIKLSTTFYVGDAETGMLASSCNMESTGVGSNASEALLSAIRKINVNDAQLKAMLTESESKIIAYYEQVGAKIILEAQGLIASKNLEDAIMLLGSVPSVCSYFATAQDLIAQCGAQIIEDNNTTILLKAKTAWSASPNKEGASEVKSILSNLEYPSVAIISEVAALNQMMTKKLNTTEKEIFDLQRLQIKSGTEITKARINAAARIASAAYAARPKYVYHSHKWF